MAHRALKLALLGVGIGLLGQALAGDYYTCPDMSNSLDTQDWMVNPFGAPANGHNQFLQVNVMSIGAACKYSEGLVLQKIGPGSPHLPADYSNWHRIGSGISGYFCRVSRIDCTFR